MKWIDTVEKGLNAVGLTGVSLIISLVGALISSIYDVKRTWWDRFLVIIGATIGAAYTGPFFAHLMHVDNQRVEAGIYFLVGLLAKELIMFLVATIRFLTQNPGAVLETLKNRFSRK